MAKSPNVPTSRPFHRLPSASEIHDAGQEFVLRHVVVHLGTWPPAGEDLSRFSLLPPEADAIVILHGYPPDRATGDAWNYLRAPVRMVLVVDGPPASSDEFNELNAMRHLERLVVRTDSPSRSGFERLQRPLSFVRSVD